jgi:hypothetical protein
MGGMRWGYINKGSGFFPSPFNHFLIVNPAPAGGGKYFDNEIITNKGWKKLHRITELTSE